MSDTTEKEGIAYELNDDGTTTTIDENADGSGDTAAPFQS
jgi:hypothetical protein